MSDSEILRCTRCGIEYEALTQEIASYSCPNCTKSKPKLKMLDSVSLKSLTELVFSSETQPPNNLGPVKNDSNNRESK